MPAEFTPDEEALYHKTGEGVARRLRKTRNPADLLSVVKSVHKEFDRAYESAPAEVLNNVACKAGCDACCHGLVEVQAHEVLIAAQFIQLNFSPEELDAVIARTAAQRDAFANRSHAERTAQKRPCALLHQGACSIYKGRPEACRAHHSPDAAACRTNLELGREQIDVYMPGLRGRMFAVMLGLDQGVEQAGFDDQAYDFGTALHEALTDSRCASRWTQRQATFSDACLESQD